MVFTEPFPCSLLHETVDEHTVIQSLLTGGVAFPASAVVIFGAMIQSKLPLSGAVAEKWKLDDLNEESVMGSQFATAVVMVATGHAEAVIQKKKEHPPCRKVFWEEPRFNPALENPNNNYGYDAHIIEERKYWQKAGKKFVGGPRFAPPRNHNGPLLPDEFAHLYEKPVPVFERSVVLDPFRRAKHVNRPRDRSVSNPEKVTHIGKYCITYISLTCFVLYVQEYLEMRTSLLGPTTYQLPDLWADSNAEGLEINGAGQSCFKSRTPRFKDRKANFLEFPQEHDGTSIPHSRGRSRGGGFKEVPRPVTEGEIAAKLAASSISTWESFQEAPSFELLPVSSQVLAQQAGAALQSGMAANRFYQVSLTKGSLHDSTPNRSRSGTVGHASQNSYSPAKDLRGSRAHTAGEGLSGTTTPGQRTPLKSRMPGFTILAKNVQPTFSAPNYSKAYKRVKLPDGTMAILPVSQQTRDVHNV
jgi:hypothetical protein